jgi:hypothetical protein
MFDRTTQDVGNIVEFGHVNTRVPDQGVATLFYVSGLGLTRDPFLMTSTDNMWINVGITQFHLPTGPAQVMPGVTVLALPDLVALESRLRRVAPMLSGTRFGFEVATDAVRVTCPWGNRLRCVVSDTTRLGIIAVELTAPKDSADGIARFYTEALGAIARVEQDRAIVSSGMSTDLVFIESDTPPPPFDGAHIQIALADFSRPHAWLNGRGLITEESNAHQYRFQAITDPATGATLCEIEHEVRSMRHPMFARPLVNRDADISLARYAPGREALALGIVA